MKYRTVGNGREEAIRKLEEITGERPAYTGMPAAAYELRGIVIGNDGTVTAGEDADMGMIARLVEAGLIREGQDAQDDRHGRTAASDGAGPDDERAEEADIVRGARANEDCGLPGPDTEDVKLEVSFPLDRHRRDSVINLVSAIYSKGSLISKSTGGTFAASKELVEKLQAAGAGSMEDAVRTIEESGGLSGVSFSEGKVTFDGFIPTSDPEEARAWTALAAAVNRNAIGQKHIRARETDEANEKYAFRTWLTRIGLKGADTKTERRILYKNLSGHTAFRTEGDREKWNAMMKAKKEREKADAGDAHARDEDGSEGRS